mgnify:CR=1 FL=1
MAEGFEKIKEGPAFEHRDIAAEKRPKKASSEIRERAQAGFFFELMEETLRNYYDAKQKNPESGRSPLSNMGFFFKKSWDEFVEPVREYEDMLAEIVAKKWESKGAKSRALTSLNERREKSLEGIKLLVPDFLFGDDKKQKNTLAKLYEGYASYIGHNEDKLEKIADDVGKGFKSSLSFLLWTKSDEDIRRSVERRQLKKTRKKGGFTTEDGVSWDAP